MQIAKDIPWTFPQSDTLWCALVFFPQGPCLVVFPALFVLVKSLEQ